MPLPPPTGPYDCTAVPQEFDELVAGEPPLRRLHLRTMFRARVLVQSNSFSYFMLAVIFANTVALAMEYDGMSPSYKQALVGVLA
jgi:hypothetical protein